MSVTFQLDMDYDIVPPWRNAPVGYEPSEDELDAYFGALADMGEFNVANGNARYILKDLLGLKIDANDLYGSLSLEDFQIRVSMIDPMAVVGGLEPSEVYSSGGATMHLVGRDIGQCERYVEALVRLCKLAEEHGVGIRWG